MGQTQIVPRTVVCSQGQSKAKDEQTNARCTRYIKLLSCAVIVIAALCTGIIGVLSWFMIRSVPRQAEAVSQHECNTETVKAKLEQDYKEIMGKNIQELENFKHEMAKIIKAQTETLNHLTETVNQQEDVNNEIAKLLESQQKTITNLTETMKLQEEYIKELEINRGSDIDDIRQFVESAGDSASTYTRWGRSDCPANGTELVYDGYVGGSQYNHKSGASNCVCLTKKPLWGNVQTGTQHHAMIYGAEYQFTGHTGNGKDYFGKDLLDFDVPCAVCRTIRPTVIMIPGRNRCFDGWTLEYHGYLAANYYEYLPTEYTCIDKSPTTVTEANVDEDGVLFYIVEAICGSLKCPPYVDGAELTCVVCSK